jgi:hypothetical protein
MLSSKDCGRRCRMAFADHQKAQYGLYRFRNRKIIFNDIAFYSLYSNFHQEQSRWWYGVPRDEWDEWGNQSLIILMREGTDVNYVMFDSNEAVALLSRCGQDISKGEKKITIRRPKGSGKDYIVEWKEFPLGNRMCSLTVSFDR